MVYLLQNKYVAKYERCSTGNQDLQMQIDANEEYLRNYAVDQVLKFQDHDVSATKLKINERPALRRLLKEIEEGKISKLIVYDRDRLARDVYEYVYIVKLCYKHNVQITFTASGVAPFSIDIIQETWYGLFAQMEGKKIQTRIYDVRSRYPQQLIGYKKVDLENQRFYKKNGEVGELISQLFQDVSNTLSLKNLIDTVIRYSKSLDRDANRIIGILNTAFYSAHGRTIEGNYFKLDHVEPIIPLSVFRIVQDVLRRYGKSYEDVVKNTMKESILIPTCGLCGKQMVFRKGKLGAFGTYMCEQHRKIRINSKHVDIALKQTVEKAIKTIDVERIQRVCCRSIKTYTNKLKQEKEILADKLEELCVNLCANFTPNSDLALINKPMKEIKSKREKLFQIEEKINQFDKLTQEIRRVGEYVKYQLENSLSEGEFLELVYLLVASIEINSNYTRINIYFDEFINESGE